MSTVLTTAPAKVILCGDHGVNRGQSALATAVDMPTLCRIATAEDGQFRLRSADHEDRVTARELVDYRTRIDGLRSKGALDEIREEARAFFAPTRYVLAQILEVVRVDGLSIEWRSAVPVSSGLGSGAAATSTMTLGILILAGKDPTPAQLIDFAWRGDVIAHGGVASALDSSTIVHGGLVRYTVAEGATPLHVSVSLPLVIGNTHVANRSTAKLNTRVRKWLETHPAKMHLFADMGHLVHAIGQTLEDGDHKTLGHLLNLHQLIQDKIGTSAPENEALIEAAIGAGALGAKIAGAGGGGIIIALAPPGAQSGIAEAITVAGGDSYVVKTGAAGLRLATEKDWSHHSKEKHNR